jgi:hypothetical protein
VQNDEMGRALDRSKIVISFSGKKLIEREHLEDLGID